MKHLSFKTVMALLISTGAWLGLTESANAAAFSFTPTGSMNMARNGHTGTLLPDGRVLVTGGYTPFVSATAEIYDPTTAQWTLTGSMSVERTYHTATLLPNGLVLAAGGYSDPSGDLITPSADLYDPATGVWTPTGSMHYPRAQNTATLLPDGTVLVTGGGSARGVPFPTEIYQPTTGKWMLAGPLKAVRAVHTATLLLDGRVLVAGGRGAGGSFLGSSELYDPTTGTWSLTGHLHEPVAGHRAVLLHGGLVLEVGGTTDNYNGFNGFKDAELYDPATGLWSYTGRSIAQRYLPGANVLDNGQVLMTGGDKFFTNPTAEALTYRPANATWAATGMLTLPRWDHTATLLPNGQVLVAGGAGKDQQTASAELGTQVLP